MLAVIGQYAPILDQTMYHSLYTVAPYIRIRSTLISHLNPLRTKLDQYWISLLQSCLHYKLNSRQVVHKAQLWSCDSILATRWQSVSCFWISHPAGFGHSVSQKYNKCVRLYTPTRAPNYRSTSSANTCFN